MTIRYIFDIKGSSSNYEVIFLKEGTNSTITCNCPAGNQGLHCKHRIALLKGDASAVISKNSHDAEKLPKEIKGTSLESAFNDYLILENDFARTKKDLAVSKRILAKEMNRL